jgi:hypothetical protein
LGEIVGLCPVGFSLAAVVLQCDLGWLGSDDAGASNRGWDHLLRLPWLGSGL